MAAKKRAAKKRIVAIVGSVTKGRSFISWLGNYVTGSDTVLQEIGSEGDVDVFINSPGGSVFAGFEILNALNVAIEQGRAVTIYVSPLAASIASYISCGVKGAKVYLSDNAKLMFHAPWTGIVGSKSQFRDTADLLEQMEGDIASAVESRGAVAEPGWFETGRATFISAKDAVRLKLADAVRLPPADLIAYVVNKQTPPRQKQQTAVVAEKSVNVTNGEVPTENMFEYDYMKIAASIEFKGYIEQLCREHYEDETLVVLDVGPGVARLRKSNGNQMSLKFTEDPLNIVSINWESASTAANASEAQQPENDDMKTLKTDKTDANPVDAAPNAAAFETAAPAAPSAGIVLDDPKNGDDAFVDGETCGGIVAIAPISPSDAAHAEEPTAPVDAASEQSAAPVAEAPKAPKAEEPKTEVVSDSGLTPDMVAFAKANYDKQKAEYIRTIKANEKNAFDDNELNAMSMISLEKLASLAASESVPNGAGGPKADNSLVNHTVPSKTPNSGTLPPPGF